MPDHEQSQEKKKTMNDVDTLKVNEKFARRFEHNERRKEEHRLKERVGKEYLLKQMYHRTRELADEDEDDEDESSSSESDEGEIEEKREKQFVEVLEKLKNKDPSVYDPTMKVYESDSSSSDDDDQKKKKKKKTTKKKKKMTLREVQARDLLKGGAEAYETDNDSDDDDGLGKRNKNAGPSYVEEQEELKNAFKKAAKVNKDDSNSEDDDDDEDEIGGLVMKKRAEKMMIGENKSKLAEVLKDEDEFLKDYMLNRKWTDVNAEEHHNNDDDDRSESSEEDLERQEQFEHEYNFRFEEPGGTSIRSHARNIDGTVRREDTRRKDNRISVKERKKTERQKLMEEVKRLKNLKREEIRSKIDLISKIGGISGRDAEKIADLTSEFDPEAHDRVMKEMYDKEGENDEDAYQELEDEDGNPIKPEFEDLDDELKALMKAPEEVNAKENERFEKIRKNMAKVDAKLQAEKELLMNNDDEDEDDEDEDDEKKTKKNDKDGDDKATNNNKEEENIFSKRALKRWKKELQQKMDEFYALDYEDFVDGLPTRFQYREVAPSNYGLTTREILTLEDRDLNQIVSLKKLAPYREDEGFLSAKNRARARELAEKFVKESASAKNKKSSASFASKKRKNKEDGANEEDDEEKGDKQRMASYAASAWGKRNKPEDTNNNNNNGDIGSNEPMDSRSRNAKKNAKKRAKKTAKALENNK